MHFEARGARPPGRRTHTAFSILRHDSSATCGYTRVSGLGCGRATRERRLPASRREGLQRGWSWKLRFRVCTNASPAPHGRAASVTGARSGQASTCADHCPLHSRAAQCVCDEAASCPHVSQVVSSHAIIRASQSRSMHLHPLAQRAAPVRCCKCASFHTRSGCCRTPTPTPRWSRSPLSKSTGRRCPTRCCSRYCSATLVREILRQHRQHAGDGAPSRTVRKENLCPREAKGGAEHSRVQESEP